MAHLPTSVVVKERKLRAAGATYRGMRRDLQAISDATDALNSFPFDKVARVSAAQTKMAYWRSQLEGYTPTRARLQLEEAEQEFNMLLKDHTNQQIAEAILSVSRAKRKLPDAARKALNFA